jgi:hypothetical protein
VQGDFIFRNKLVLTIVTDCDVGTIAKVQLSNGLNVYKGKAWRIKKVRIAFYVYLITYFVPGWQASPRARHWRERLSPVCCQCPSRLAIFIILLFDRCTFVFLRILYFLV